MTGGEVSNEVAVLDTVTMHWSKLFVNNTPPLARDECVTTMVGNTVYCFGG